jgi:outer membrane receptor for ferrienterochelin and colicin
MNQIARNHFYQLDSDSWALFAQGTFNFTDSLRLTVGVRYTEEKQGRGQHPVPLGPGLRPHLAR